MDRMEAERTQADEELGGKRGDQRAGWRAVLVNRALSRVGHASPEQTPLSFSFNLLIKLDLLQYNYCIRRAIPTSSISLDAMRLK